MSDIPQALQDAQGVPTESGDAAAHADVVVTINYGRVELVSCHKWEGGKLVLGGYARHYDEHGALTKTTDPSWNGRVDFGGMSDAEVFAITGPLYPKCGAAAAVRTSDPLSTREAPTE
jgi:hypothetical protein